MLIISSPRWKKARLIQLTADWLFTLGSKHQVGFNCVSCVSHPPWTSGYLGHVICSLSLLLGHKMQGMGVGVPLSPTLPKAKSHFYFKGSTM